jgi:Zn ribbon nucleic-acid-binding protein
VLNEAGERASRHPDIHAAGQMQRKHPKEEADRIKKVEQIVDFFPRLHRCSTSRD